MPSIGEKLIASIVQSGSGVDEYVKLGLPKEWFLGGDSDLHEFVETHIANYGVVPSEETLYKSLDIELPKTTEPPKYYADHLEDRYIQTTLKKNMLEAQKSLKVKDPKKALAVLDKALGGLVLTRNRNQIVNYTEEAAGLIHKDMVQKKLHGDDYGIPMGWPHMDKVTKGLTIGDLVSIVGRPACLSGSTKLYVSRKGKGSGRYYTLEQLYKGFHGQKISPRGKLWDLSIPTKIQSLMQDDLTGLNILEDVLKTGVKETYTVLTESGKCIRATKDHRFLTDNGWSALEDLQVGSLVVVKAPNTIKSDKKVRRYYKEVCTKLPYSPYSTHVISGIKYHRVKESRLSYDAWLNHETVDNFLHCLKEGGHSFTFSNPKMHVHHKDRNIDNNNPHNLELISNSDHGRGHAKEEVMRARFGKNLTELDTILSIIYYGEEDTYDLVVEDPYNNFIAQEFVTHNSGKTYLELFMAYNCWQAEKIPMVMSMEMPPMPLIHRLVALHTKVPITELKNAELDTKMYETKVKGVLLAQVDNNMPPFWIVDGNLAATVSDIKILCKQLKPNALYVDGAYLLEPDIPYIRGPGEKVKNTCEGLKKHIVGDVGIPAVASYQFNRDQTKNKDNMEKELQATGLEHIAGGDAIGQISSIVLGLFQEETVETLMRKHIKVLKGRNGESGGFDINWLFDNYPFMDFSEIIEETLEDLQFM